ncbi:MAG: hypothetical protein KBT27_05175 [Prevotellaceae bacterium]|nr:hypothetical protein [Candidatus Faecinaster equi]
MTNEENVLNALCYLNKDVCYTMPMCDDGLCKDTSEHRCPIQISLEALEKQIAKKPWSQADDDTCLYYHNECPYCGRWLSERIKPHHCVCGQAIDWSDGE